MFPLLSVGVSFSASKRPPLSVVVVVVLRGGVRRPAAEVAVTPAEQAQLLQGLLVVVHLGPLGEEAGGHAVEVQSAGAAMQLRQPRADGGARLEGRQDGHRGDRGGPGCTDGTMIQKLKKKLRHATEKRSEIETRSQPGGGCRLCRKP